MKKNPFKKLFSRTTATSIQKEIKGAIPVVKDRLQQANEIMQESVKKIIPLREDNPETRYFKILGLSFVALMLVAALAATATLLLTLRSPESVAVPDTVGLDLASAIESVQEFGLVPRLEQRFYPDPSSKGKVMEQNPTVGVTVRVGREVNLIVSKGASLEKLPNYVGRNIEEVKQEIHTQFTGDSPLVQIDNLAYAFDESESGTILAQEPGPGSDLNKPVALNLLVSRGKDATLHEVPAVLGLPWDKAMFDLINAGIPFSFDLAAAQTEAAPGTIVSQDPAAAQPLKNGDSLKLTMTAPETSPTQVFGIYTGTLPVYASPVDITISSVSPGAAPRILYQFKHSGGNLSFPYLVDDNTELVVTAFDKEMDRRLIKKN